MKILFHKKKFEKKEKKKKERENKNDNNSSKTLRKHEITHKIEKRANT